MTEGELQSALAAIGLLILATMLLLIEFEGYKFRSIKVIKSAIKRLIPNQFHPNQLARSRIVKYSRGRIVSGPFTGQVHLTDAEDFIEPGMLMGCYEKEIHPAIDRVLAAEPPVFVGIGASQGYFAVGFAKLVPQARHIAFEFYEPRIQQLKRTALANQVSVELMGQCNPETLNNVLTDGAFVICDVDGYENELIDPVKVPRLKTATMIIETHENLFGGDTIQLLSGRFSATHSIEIIDSQDRTYDDLPFRFKDKWTLGQLNEGRGAPQSWMFMMPIKH